MTFVLPDLLAAERTGRALALRHRCTSPLTVLAGPDLEGAAALAAARHLANLRVGVQICLAGDEADSPQVFRTMLQVVRKMGLTMVADGAASPVPGTISGQEGTALPPWDGYSRALAHGSNPFVQPADPGLARQAEAVREVDRSSIQDYGLPGICLMENAGIGATVVATEMMKTHSSAGEDGGCVAILVGFGNNGGDGLVVARGLLERGVQVRVFTLCETERLKGDARINAELLAQQPDVIQMAPDSEEALIAALRDATLVVDGLFGTGLDRRVEGLPAQAVRAMNRSRVPVLALDIPSGLHADSGRILGVCAKATTTVTFAAPKIGLYEGAGRDLSGEIFLAHIGCPQALLDPCR